jgi:hypothetical protein
MQTELPVTDILSSACGDTSVYVLGKDENGRTTLLSISMETGTYKELPVDDDTYLIESGIDGLWVAIAKEDENVLKKLDKGGKVLIQVSVAEKFTDMAADNEQNLLAATKKEVFVFSPQGEETGVIMTGENFDIGDLIKLSDGRILARTSKSGENGQITMLADVKKGSLVDFTSPLGAYSDKYINTYSGFGGNDDAYVLSSSYDFTIESGVLAYAVDMAGQKMTPRFDTSGIDAMGEIAGLYPVKNSFVLLSEDDQGCTCLRLDPTSEKKKLLTVGKMKNNNSYVTKAMIDFNKSSREYHAIYRDYGNDDQSETRFNLDLINGTPPDIMSLLMTSYEVYAPKGIFADLYPMLDSDPDISRQDLVGSVLRSLEWTDGSLYRICPTYLLSVCGVEKSFLEDKDSLTIEDIYEITKENPEMTLCRERGGMYLLNVLIGGQFHRFADIQASEFHFDDQEFIDFLNFLKEMNDRAESFTPGETDYLDHRALLDPFSIKSIDDYKLYTERFPDMRFIGDPSDNGTGFRINAPICFSVLKGTGNEKAAWEFIKVLLSQEYQENVDFLPVRLSVLRELTDKAMEITPEQRESAYVNPNGAALGRDERTYEYTVPELPGLTQSQIDDFYAMLDNADRLVEDTMSNDYFRIFAEECGALFAGDKSAEETAKIIQNKIVIYFEERK